VASNDRDFAIGRNSANGAVVELGEEDVAMSIGGNAENGVLIGLARR
jgi:hypothetical protein